MKLFLSSMHPTNKDELFKLLDNPAHPKVVVIPCAWDTYPPERREAEVSQQLAAFKEYGFETSLLDLTNATAQTVKESLEGKNLVWVMGGNTFYLNYYMRTSGFAGVIKDLLEKGLVYGGESAGAVVAGSTLHGIENVDDPKEAPGTIWDGLGLIEQGIVPHWGWEKYQKDLETAKKEMETFTEVLTISNDQALVINDSHRELIDNPL